jgi:ORF6N domain
MPTADPVLLPNIELRIQSIRGLRVIVDGDLALLYGVETKRLNEQIKRNRERFPADFLFQLTLEEKMEVVAHCDHLQKLKYSKALPFAFTEHGAIQAASVLASAQAVEMGIYVVRAFVHLRQAAILNSDLAQRLAELEHKTELIEMSHDTFSRNTKVQLKQMLDTLRELTTPLPVPMPPKRPIGFITPDNKPNQ